MEGKEENISKNIEPDISILEAGIKGLSEENLSLRSQINAIRNESRNIIIGVLVAGLLITVTVAIEVILFHTGNNKSQNELYEEINKIKESNLEKFGKLQDELRSLNLQNESLKNEINQLLK
jgi:hypothetical protein